MAASGWTLVELDPGVWRAVDERTAAVYELSGDLGERLWAHHVLWALPLPLAIQAVRGGKAEAAPSVDLEMLGGTVRYSSWEKEVVDRLRADFPSSPSRGRRRADAVVRIEPEADFERLHRAVEGLRQGVSFLDPLTGTWIAVPGRLPVIPPLQAAPWAERFWALHAALLVLPRDRALFVCAEQGVGKTTTARWALQNRMAEVAGDEVAAVDSLTGLAWAVPLPMAVRAGDERIRIPLAGVEDLHRRPLTPAGVVVLRPGFESAGGGITRATTIAESVDVISPHVRDGGARAAATFLGVSRLVAAVPVFSAPVGRWPGLEADIEAALSHVVHILEEP